MTTTEKENADFRELGELLARLAGGELSDKEPLLEQLFEELGDEDDY